MNRVETWANCNMVGLVLTTNNYAVVFNTLKNTMLPGSKNQLDIFLHALLKRSRVDATSINKMIKTGAGFKDKTTQKVHRTSICKKFGKFGKTTPLAGAKKKLKQK